MTKRGLDLAPYVTKPTEITALTPCMVALQCGPTLALRLHIRCSAMGRSFESCRQVAFSRILIVDDEEYIRDVMAMILDGLGYSVTATGDGFEALRRLEEEPYELVISDLKMPGLDGVALYNEILGRWPIGGPRVLFTSGSAETSRHEEAPRALDVPLLFKPFSVDDLRDAVSRVLTAV